MPEAAGELPPLESLTPDSDFRPFMKPEVEPGIRRQALKALFRDPQFNVMDGFEAYVGDFSKPDPMPESWLSQLAQVARLGDFREQPAEPAAEATAEGAERVPEVVEKPYEDQGNTLAPPSDASDTESGQVGKPPVTE